MYELLIIKIVILCVLSMIVSKLFIDAIWNKEI